MKGWNTEEVDKYAELVDLGRPDFIEIKGVTFCGDSGKSGPARLTMENVPWHAEVIEFAEQMADRLNQVELPFFFWITFAGIRDRLGT